MILNLFATPSALPWNHGKDALVRTPYFRSAEDCVVVERVGTCGRGQKKYQGPSTDMSLPTEISNPCSSLIPA